jgi:hypothetical protein
MYDDDEDDDVIYKGRLSSRSRGPAERGKINTQKPPKRIFSSHWLLRQWALLLGASQEFISELSH